MTTLTFQLSNLPDKKAKEIHSRAQELGVTQDRYIKKLIEDDLAQERRARMLTWDEIAAPFRRTMGKISDEELDRLVDAARTRRHQRNPRGKR